MTSSSPLRLAVFDLDGTLLDSANSIVTGVLDCWEVCGFPMPDSEQVRRIIGLPWDQSVRLLLPGAGDEEFALIGAYHDEIRRGERTRPHREEGLFDGVIDLLDALEEVGYLLAIITSRSSGRLNELLDAQGIGNRFISLKTTDNGPGKPNPFLMNQTLSETGVNREETVMIGDTTFDMLMARSAGTSAIGVSWGVHERDELQEAGALYVVDAMHELPTVIHRMTGY
jgi:phosphoglycolate phosphatase